MSDTPRTDEAECFIDSDRGITDSGLARQLERELIAANERIKRLEKAGDAMFIRSTRVGREIWTKAKEAKP